jgi:hypothetical protein
MFSGKFQRNTLPPSLFTLVLYAAGSSETLVSIYETLLRHVTEHSDLHRSHRRENLKIISDIAKRLHDFVAVLRAVKTEHPVAHCGSTRVRKGGVNKRTQFQRRLA